MQNATASTLHTLNAPQSELFQRLMRCVSSGDSLVLIENGVYIVSNEHALESALSLNIHLYCLQADINARGLQQWPARMDARLSNKIHVITYDGFVVLACRHTKVVSWFL